VQSDGADARLSAYPDVGRRARGAVPARGRPGPSEAGADDAGADDAAVGMAAMIMGGQ
jgi:hypothetical protein